MIRLIRFADCPPAPWKNGAGATRELWKRSDPAGEVLARISVAEITGAQPFSSFPGIDRVILQLEGPPMTLTIDGAACPLAPLSPQPFAGEAIVTCALAGGGRALDLNLMCRRGVFRPSMRLIEAPADEILGFGKGGDVAALLALGPCDIAGGLTGKMGKYDLLVAERPAEIRADRAARFIRIDALGQA